MEREQEFAALQSGWKAPAELRGSPPREVRLSPGGIFVAVLSGILILGGPTAAVGLRWVSERQSDEQKLLKEQGKNTEATVTNLWRTGDRDKRPMVAYQFSLDGRAYRHSVKAPLRVWKSLTSGSTLAVRYLPSDPAHNHPTDWSDSPMPIWAGVMILVLTSSPGVGLVFMLRRQLALLRDGRPAPAVVRRYSHAQHGQKNIYYDFPLLGGGVQKGKSGPTRKVPAIGATICILYDRDNPRRNAAYPLEMARLQREL